MTALTPALDSALRADAATVFGAVSIDLPTAQVNLLDGAGLLSFGGRTYVGEDATYGVLSDVEDITDGTGDSAPAFSLTILPSGAAAAAALAAPDMQGSQVRVWFGAINPLTGLVIPDPHLLFLGELDVPSLISSGDGRRLDYEVVSVFERLFEDDESARLSDGFHRSIFPNEFGLEYVTGVAEPVYWGVAGNPSAVVQNAFGKFYKFEDGSLEYRE